MERDLTIATFNAENFYLLLDRDYTREELDGIPDADYMAMNSSIFNPNKERGKIAAIAETILSRDFDFVGLCEVGGMETLRNFNRLYLGSRYRCYLREENSRRGIFVGALVKEGSFDDVSARNVPGAFSRNLMEVTLASGGSTLRVFVVHLKSQYGQDRGIAQRMLEVAQLCTLAAPPNCVVLGDFNGVLVPGQTEFEYEPFTALPFRDVLEAMGVPPGARFSHYYFNGSAPSFSQLDYIFCSNDMDIRDGGVLADLVPINYAQRRRLPSDHAFVWAAVRPAVPTGATGS